MITLQARTSGNRFDITLDAMTADVARHLGPALAAIEPWARYPISGDALTAYFSAVESDAPRYALSIDGTAAGVIGIRQNWLRGPYLQFLGILPPFQTLGLGQTVLAWLEETARAGGESNIWVAASDFNNVAQRFYERHGFQRAAVLDDLVRDGVAEVLFRKRLAPQSASHP